MRAPTPLQAWKQHPTDTDVHHEVVRCIDNYIAYGGRDASREKVFIAAFDLFFDRIVRGVRV